MDFERLESLTRKLGGDEALAYVVLGRSPGKNVLRSIPLGLLLGLCEEAEPGSRLKLDADAVLRARKGIFTEWATQLVSCSAGEAPGLKKFFLRKMAQTAEGFWQWASVFDATPESQRGRARCLQKMAANARDIDHWVACWQRAEQLDSEYGSRLMLLAAEKMTELAITAENQNIADCVKIYNCLCKEKKSSHRLLVSKKLRQLIKQGRCSLEFIARSLSQGDPLRSELMIILAGQIEGQKEIWLDSYRFGCQLHDTECCDLALVKIARFRRNFDWWLALRTSRENDEVLRRLAAEKMAETAKSFGERIQLAVLSLTEKSRRRNAMALVQLASNFLEAREAYLAASEFPSLRLQGLLKLRKFYRKEEANPF